MAPEAKGAAAAARRSTRLAACNERSLRRRAAVKLLNELAEEVCPRCILKKLVASPHCVCCRWMSGHVCDAPEASSLPDAAL